MHSYALYVESGPKRMKTMVHVPELLGCTVNGPTTGTTLEATPAAMRQFLAFMASHGEAVNPEEPFETHIVEHITEGTRLGQGGLDIIHRDLEAIDSDEIEVLLGRFEAMNDTLTSWVSTRSAAQQNTTPERGWSARKMLLHVLGPMGQYVSLAVGGVPGVHALHTAAERGEIEVSEALDRAAELVMERVRATTSEQRAAVFQHGAEGQRTRTLRSSLRHLLEHHWEHLADLASRPEGPQL